MPGPIVTQHATGTVDKLIGSAYPVVKKVAQNIVHVRRVSEHISEIDGVFESIDHIYGVYNNIAVLSALSTNIDGIIGIAQHFDEIMEIYNNLADIVDAEAVATAAITLARNWANADYNTEIELGMYSSKHWSIVSQNSADTSQSAASTASGHAVSASASASAAETARDQAVAAKDTAVAAEDDAVLAKNAAQLAETNAELAQAAAELARDQAQTAETAAELAETNAETAQAAAEAARDTAQGHATNAGNSATSASGSASTASTQAGIATTKAGEALASANAADASADAALLSEQNADASEAAALGYRNTAQTHATNAATAQTNTEAARDATIAAQTAAQTAEINAETAETNAETAQAAAEAARDAAITAKNAAETAETNAETAETNAVAAKTASEAARDISVAASQVSGGIRYVFDGSGVTADDPGTGKVRFNNATLSSVTQLYISETDAASRSIAALIQSWDDASNAGQRATLQFRKVTDPSVFAIYHLTAGIADNGTYNTLNTLTHVSSNGTFADGDALVLEVVRNGLAGAIGGVHLTYNNTTTDSDPGSGVMRFNDTTIASVTEIYIDNLDANGNSITNWLSSLDDSSSVIKGYLYLRGYTNQTAFAIFKVNSVTDMSGYRKLGVTYLNAGGPFSNNTIFGLVFAPTGDAGTGAVTTVNGQSGNVVIDPDDLDDTSTTNKWTNAADKLKISYITVTQAVDLDVIEAAADLVAGIKTKTDWITITQAVDLDAIEARVNALDAVVILKGTWDASSGTFPGGGTAQAGESYIVSVAGTVNGVSFAINDRIIALVDNASTTTFSPNWFKADYTDQVLSVVGLTGAINAGDLKTALALVKGDVGLGNVDNTSDATKLIAAKQVTYREYTGTSDTLVLGDAGNFVGSNNASANTCTIPPNASVAFPVNTVINFGQRGAGQTTITPGAGVTFIGGKYKISPQYGTASAIQISANTWWIFGSVTA